MDLNAGTDRRHTFAFGFAKFFLSTSAVLASCGGQAFVLYLPAALYMSFSALCPAAACLSVKQRQERLALALVFLF
jgi:hypothetical protein